MWSVRCCCCFIVVHLVAVLLGVCRCCVTRPARIASFGRGWLQSPFLSVLRRRSWFLIGFMFLHLGCCSVSARFSMAWSSWCRRCFCDVPVSGCFFVVAVLAFVLTHGFGRRCGGTYLGRVGLRSWFSSPRGCVSLGYRDRGRRYEGFLRSAV